MGVTWTCSDRASKASGLDTPARTQVRKSLGLHSLEGGKSLLCTLVVVSALWNCHHLSSDRSSHLSLGSSYSCSLRCAAKEVEALIRRDSEELDMVTYRLDAARTKASEATSGTPSLCWGARSFILLSPLSDRCSRSAPLSPPRRYVPSALLISPPTCMVCLHSPAQGRDGVRGRPGAAVESGEDAGECGTAGGPGVGESEQG